ncbi:MAG: wax ester/triacylglycerol synthase domain-containing protein [Actinomycetota bacterium]
MSDHEALMWNIEKDPWLNPNGASLTILDTPVDMDRFRNQIAFGVSKMPRLYQRVVPGLGRFTPPTWVPDAEFNLDYHVREVTLPAPGTQRQLFDLAAALYEEPLDRTRPLWRFVSIRGLEGGRGAIYSLTHHVIADGIGQLRMAEMYQQIDPNQPSPDPVDLDTIVSEAVAAHRARADESADFARSLPSSTRRTATHLLKRQLGLSRRIAGEMMLWPADTNRVVERVEDVASTVQSTVELLNRPNNSDPGGSPLWKNRSRHRHLEYVQIPLADLKAAAAELGGSINDAFMIGLTEAAHRYHQKRDTDVETFNTSFVVSTRTDDNMGGNSFTPVLVQVGGRSASFKKRMRELQKATAEARERSDQSGGMSGLSGLINLLPTSVVTSMARRQAAHMDFATSNLRGAPIPLYCVGSRIDATICMGPLAGTAANVTALSTNGNFDIGLFVDPKAIEDPADYRQCVAEAFADLLSGPSEAETSAAKKTTTKRASATRSATAKKSSTNKTPARKTTAKKPTTTKAAGTKKPAAKKTATKKPAAKKATSKKTTSKKTTSKRLISMSITTGPP